jgi:hypothetical protein
MILKIFSMAFSAVYEERESSLCLGARWAQSPAAKPKGRSPAVRTIENAAAHLHAMIDAVKH